MSDPTFSMTYLVPSERWANNDDVVKMLVVFFSMKSKKGTFSQSVGSMNITIYRCLI